MNAIESLKEQAQYYSPADAATIISGGTATLEFRGLSGDLFAFNRLNIGCDNPAALNQILATAKLDQGRITLFENVQLEALKRLFANRSLEGGYIIDFNRALQLVLTNDSANQRDISVDLNGYDEPHYQALLMKYENSGRKIPKPQFVYGSATIAASADQQRITMNLPIENVRLSRIAISSTGDDDLKISFRVNNTEIIPTRYVSQINSQFENMAIIQPITLLKNLPFEAFISNANAVNSREISIICECYEV